MVKIQGADISFEKANGRGDVEVVLSGETMNEIMAGRMTFQRAFMGGSMTLKGEYGIMRSMDELFTFM